MRINMRYQISGTRNGKAWPSPGGEIELPPQEATALIAQGMATAVVVPEKVETAKAPATAETREEAPKVPARKSPGRPRKTPSKGM